MFDFLDSDWFIIGLEIVFLIFIAYDARLYIKTKKREYLLNISLAIGFAVWTLYPFYNKYYSWPESDRLAFVQECLGEHNASYCDCVDDMIFKEYDINSFREIERESDREYLEFIAESEKECLEK